MYPPETFARFLGNVMPGDLIFSCMAGVSRFFVNSSHRPAVIEWAGEAEPGKHPSWVSMVRKLRDPATGQLIPRLVAMFRAGEPKRIAAFGFSAGSNSGLRELLRHPKDRAMVSFVGSIDGLHPTTNWNATALADFDLQVLPFAEYALRAARGEATMVITGNNLAAPTATTYQTPQTMRLINQWVVKKLGGTDAVKDYPTNMALIREFLSKGGPVPNGVGGIGRAYWFEYPGTQKRDHIEQANIVTPNVVRTFLADAWKSEDGPSA